MVQMQSFSTNTKIKAKQIKSRIKATSSAIVYEIHKYANLHECKNVQKALTYLNVATGRTGRIS